eukprot:1105869-Prorocentrum_minimum.AAC.1
MADAEEVVVALLEAGAEVNVQNIKGRSPLHDSAAFGHVGVTQKLLEAGAEVNVQNNEGNSPLHLAIAREEPWQKYREEEHEWESRVAKYTRELEETVRALLEAGAELNMQNNKGVSPLHDSIERGHIG